jgi:hypothetical protein
MTACAKRLRRWLSCRWPVLLLLCRLILFGVGGRPVTNLLPIAGLAHRGLVCDGSARVTREAEGYRNGASEVDCAMSSGIG